jgi:hypothetical protein
MPKQDRQVRIFENRKHPGFEFTAPGVMMGTENLQVEMTGRGWRITWEEPGYSDTVQEELYMGAILKLVTRRLGLDATFRLRTSQPGNYVEDDS